MGMKNIADHNGRAAWGMNCIRPVRTLESCVRIPLEELTAVCVYSVCGALCVGSGLATGWSPSKESYRLCKRLRTEKAAKAQQRVVAPQMNEWLKVFSSSNDRTYNIHTLLPKIFCTVHTLFWDVTSFSQEDVHRRFGTTCYIQLQGRTISLNFLAPCLACPLPWRWKQYVPPKSRWTSPSLHGLTYQKFICTPAHYNGLR
jgi:hypothetical protein